MSIRRYRREHTHREHLAWLAWLDMEWNRPDRHDHYAMVVAAEVRRVLSQRPSSILPQHFKLKFEGADPPPLDGVPVTPRVKPTAEQVASWSKARWVGMLGNTVVKRDVTHDTPDDAVARLRAANQEASYAAQKG